MKKLLLPICIALFGYVLCGVATPLADREHQLEQARSEFFNIAYREFVPVVNYTLTEFTAYGHRILNDPELQHVRNAAALQPIIANLTAIVTKMEQLQRSGDSFKDYVTKSAESIEAYMDFWDYYTGPDNAATLNDVQKHMGAIMRKDESVNFGVTFERDIGRYMSGFYDKCMPSFDAFVNMLTMDEKTSSKHFLVAAYHNMLRRDGRSELHDFFVFIALFRENEIEAH